MKCTMFPFRDVLLFLIYCSFNPLLCFVHFFCSFLQCRKVQYSQLLVFWSSRWGTHAFMWPGWWPLCCRQATTASAKSSASLTPWTFCWWGVISSYLLWLNLWTHGFLFFLSPPHFIYHLLTFSLLLNVFVTCMFVMEKTICYAVWTKAWGLFWVLLWKIQFKIIDSLFSFLVIGLIL